MKAALVALALLAVSACSTPPSEPLAAPTSVSAVTSRTDDLPLTVSSVKVKGQNVVTVSWDATLVRTDSVVLLRQNQSVQPTFVRWVLVNSGTFIDTLPKGKTPVTPYFYWYCEWPNPDDTHCAYDWVAAR